MILRSEIHHIKLMTIHAPSVLTHRAHLQTHKRSSSQFFMSGVSILMPQICMYLQKIYTEHNCQLAYIPNYFPSLLHMLQKVSEAAINETHDCTPLHSQLNDVCNQHCTSQWSRPISSRPVMWSELHFTAVAHNSKSNHQLTLQQPGH